MHSETHRARRSTKGATGSYMSAIEDWGTIAYTDCRRKGLRFRHAIPTENARKRPAPQRAAPAISTGSIQPPFAPSFRRAPNSVVELIDSRDDFPSGRGQPGPSRTIPATVPFDPSANVHPSADVPHVAGHVMACAADTVLVREPVVEIAQQFDLRPCDAHDDPV